MGASKELFLQMREQDFATLYDATFSKKQAISTGKQLADNVINGGNVSKHEVLANLVRLSEVVNSAITELKDNVCFEKVSVLGVEFTPMNGRTMYNFKEDEVYNQLATELKQREELLKVALNQSEAFYDSEGVEVPKVSKTSAKSSLTIKF
jgi:hypothetical protein